MQTLTNAMVAVSIASASVILIAVPLAWSAPTLPDRIPATANPSAFTARIETASCEWPKPDPNGEYVVGDSKTIREFQRYIECVLEDQATPIDSEYVLRALPDARVTAIRKAAETLLERFPSSDEYLSLVRFFRPDKCTLWLQMENEKGRSYIRLFLRDIRVQSGEGSYVSGMKIPDPVRMVMLTSKGPVRDFTVAVETAHGAHFVDMFGFAIRVRNQNYAPLLHRAFAASADLCKDLDPNG